MKRFFGNGVYHQKKSLFFVTSPREANKLPDEIKVLVNHFSGRTWNPKSQAEFYGKLCKLEFFEGALTGDLAFKARDRINRAPQSLGLVNLKPVIALTEAGKSLIYGHHREEALLRQLVKFQFPSIYHIDQSDRYHVKPYLELMRFVQDLGGLTKIEVAMFVMQLLDYRDYGIVKNKIERFRLNWKNHDRTISYNQYVDDCFSAEMRIQYAEEIADDNISTRESSEQSVALFISTKKANQRDYADAAIRYLRATGFFTYNPLRNKVQILKGKEADVLHLLTTIDRAPFAYSSTDDFKAYLFSPSNIALLSDNKDLLLYKLANSLPITPEIRAYDLEALKKLVEDHQKQKLEEITESEIDVLKNYTKYDEIIAIYEKIKAREMVDKPLYLEWNTWRALNMLDDGKIQGNFVVDDEGLPLYTAAGNKPDIECQYPDFDMTVEVTMSSGHKQYEMEGEPVARHLGNKAKLTEKDTYCLFIAPTISEAALAYFYNLHRTNIAFYGGIAKIIPLPLEDFQSLLHRAHQSAIKPSSRNLRDFVKNATNWATNVADEIEWLEKIRKEARANF